MMVLLYNSSLISVATIEKENPNWIECHAIRKTGIKKLYALRNIDLYPRFIPSLLFKNIATLLILSAFH